MVVYTKLLDQAVINKAYIKHYQCKVVQDIIENVLAGNVKVKNEKRYDEMYKEYMQNMIAYDEEIKKIEKDLIGDDVIIPDSTVWISPIRGMFLMELNFNDPEKVRDVENFLLRKGFERLVIE